MLYAKELAVKSSLWAPWLNGPGPCARVEQDTAMVKWIRSGTMVEVVREW